MAVIKDNQLPVGKLVICPQVPQASDNDGYIRSIQYECPAEAMMATEVNALRILKTSLPLEEDLYFLYFFFLYHKKHFRSSFSYARPFKWLLNYKSNKLGSFTSYICSKHQYRKIDPKRPYI